uniref:Uncharacterized protein n=1 Tax=Anguilla anguilla TaxID=7936 RepID=A0A0E9SII3_ANGAN
MNTYRNELIYAHMQEVKVQFKLYCKCRNIAKGQIS